MALALTITGRFLAFTTISSWEGSSGRAHVTCRLGQVAGSNPQRWNLIREIRTEGTNNVISQGVMSQFISTVGTRPAIEVGTFGFAGGNWTYNSTTQAFNSSNTPSAVRVTMDLQDRQARVTRTLSRTFWIATGN